MTQSIDDVKVNRIMQIMDVAFEQFELGIFERRVACRYLESKRKQCIYIYDEAMKILKQ